MVWARNCACRTCMLVESETVIRMGLVFTYFCQLGEGVGGCLRALMMEQTCSRFNVCCALPAGLYALQPAVLLPAFTLFHPPSSASDVGLGTNADNWNQLSFLYFFIAGTQIQYHNSLKFWDSRSWALETLRKIAYTRKSPIWNFPVWRMDLSALPMYVLFNHRAI